MDFWYKFLNIFFFVFHIALIFFNLFGWIFKSLRRWNLLTLGLTAFSWLGLGVFFGFGYCFLTDWHWQVRDELKYSTDSNSYIHFLITSIFRVHMSERTVDLFTAIFFALAFLMSTITNAIDWRKKNSLLKRP